MNHANDNRSGVYVARDNIGICQVCGREDDLRFGCCFGCADHVSGKAVHLLWDRRNPEKRWLCGDGGGVIEHSEALELLLKAKGDE